MTLWDRVERWRAVGCSQDKYYADGKCPTCAAYSERAAELEADLRELSTIVERIDHIGESHINRGHARITCSRCALEAKLGGRT